MAADARWYAVYTRSRHEKKVAQEFAEAEIEHYLPLTPRERRWKDRRKVVEFPVFPGYLFVREDLTSQGAWVRKERILEPQGVVKILSTPKNRPIPVPDKEVQAIRTVLEHNLKVDPYRYDFKPGQPLTIRKGPLAGVEGHLIERKGVYQLILKVDMLNRAVAVTISAADVEASL